MTVPTCEETGKYMDKIKEGLIKPAPEADTCTPAAGKKTWVDAEIKILKGEPPSSGEIPTAIADEQIKLSDLRLKEAERDNIGLLLCGASTTQDAYSSINNCLAITLSSESVELPKLLGELNKLTADSAKEFPAIAEKIKKAYEQICAVKSAFNAMKQCIDKVCNADEKKLLKDELASLVNIEKEVDALVKQGEEAVMSVVQAASIFALNNIAGLETLVGGVKPLAEQFKKDTDANVEASAKKAAEWQKKYGEAIAAVAVAHGEYGKASTLKYGKEAAYCFINQSKAQMQSQYNNLINLFVKTNPNP